MAKKKSTSLLSSYRKRKQSGKSALLIVAAVLILAGLALIGAWATGRLGGSAWSVFATKTPTPTNTFTPTPVTPTNTATMMPPTETPTVTPTPTQAGPIEYKVKENDTCYSIAKENDLDMQFLIALNNLPPDCPLRLDQIILLPAPWQTMPTSTPIPDDIRPGTVIDYIVEPGATFASIAQWFHSSVDRILYESNKYRQSQGKPLWTQSSQLFIGDLVKVPVKIVTPTPTLTATRTSTPVGFHLTLQAATPTPTAP